MPVSPPIPPIAVTKVAPPGATVTITNVPGVAGKSQVRALGTFLCVIFERN